MKIALEIYLNHMSSTDVNPVIIDLFIDVLRGSPRFHEVKLFFLLNHIDNMDVEQLNRLVDVLQISYCWSSSAP